MALSLLVRLLDESYCSVLCSVCKRTDPEEAGDLTEQVEYTESCSWGTREILVHEESLSSDLFHRTIPRDH